MNTTTARASVASEILPPYRTVGMSPADYIEAVQAEIDRVLEEVDGDQRKAFSSGFARMRQEGLITDSDVKRLETMSIALIEVEHGKHPAAEVVPKLHKLYLEALADPAGSATGATILGLSYSARSNQTGKLAGLMGMVVGGILTGGPGGALVGGLVGWVAGGGCKSE